MSEPDTVVVTFPAFALDGHAYAGALADAGLRVRLAPKRGHRSTAEVAALLEDAVGAIVSTDPFDSAVFDACPGLRVVARVGVGIDSIDLEAATEAGVVVTTTPRANVDAVADHTLGLILAVLRRIVEADASVRRGEWLRGMSDLGWELHGTTVGILGLGEIGHAVALRLQGFDCTVLAYDLEPREAEGVEWVPLEELLGRADVVTVHVPLNESTRVLVGAGEFALMRPDAVLVSTSRGGVVDEAALYEVLTTNRLRAAALDVFLDEPPLGSPLLELQNVVLTPHVAGLSVASVARMLTLASESIITVLEGGVPPAVANPAVLAAR